MQSNKKKLQRLKLPDCQRPVGVAVSRYLLISTQCLNVKPRELQNQDFTNPQSSTSSNINAANLNVCSFLVFAWD